jgi:hypothetical protein
MLAWMPWQKSSPRRCGRNVAAGLQHDSSGPPAGQVSAKRKFARVLAQFSHCHFGSSSPVSQPEGTLGCPR